MRTQVHVSKGEMHSSETGVHPFMRPPEPEMRPPMHPPKQKCVPSYQFLNSKESQVALFDTMYGRYCRVK